MKTLILFLLLCTTQMSLCMNHNITTQELQRFEEKHGKLIIVTFLSSPQLLKEHDKLTKNLVRSILKVNPLMARAHGLLIIYERSNPIPEHFNLPFPSKDNLDIYKFGRTDFIDNNKIAHRIRCNYGTRSETKKIEQV